MLSPRPTLALVISIVAAAGLAVLAAPLPASAAGPSRSATAKPAPRPGPVTGTDISYPQCPSSHPSGAAFGIVGVNDGLPWSTNPCLASQFAWASGLGRAPGFYANTANPGPVSSHWNLGGPATCADPTSASDPGCAYNYGWNAAAQSFMAAATRVSTTAARTRAWWLDVETSNSWSGAAAANAADIQGGLDYLAGRGVSVVGIYSTGYQWGVITGGYRVTAAPNWVAGANDASQAAAMCAPAYSFSGGRVNLVQYISGNFDRDRVCS